MGQDCRHGIYKRQVFDPIHGYNPNQLDTSIADTIESLPAKEAAITRVQYTIDMFNQISDVPALERLWPQAECTDSEMHG